MSAWQLLGIVGLTVVFTASFVSMLYFVFAPWGDDSDERAEREDQRRITAQESAAIRERIRKVQLALAWEHGYLLGVRDEMNNWERADNPHLDGLSAHV